MFESQAGTSYYNILRLAEENPSTLAVFPDEYLNTLTNPIPPDPEVSEVLTGEILVRFWLYQNNRPAFAEKFIREHFGEDVSALIERRSINLPDSGPFSAAIQAYFQKRTSDFVNCDGIISLVSIHDLNDAVALPFDLIPDNEPEICDRQGLPIPNWKAPVSILGDSSKGHMKVVLKGEFGSFSKKFEGNSLGLPICLATQRQSASLVGEFDPLDLIASGAVVTGCLEPVDGIAAKQRLADKMGAKFVVVSDEEISGKNTLLLSPNSKLDDAYEAISRAIDDWAICQLDPESSAKKIDVLYWDLRLGTVNTTAAMKRLNRYESVLQTAEKNSYLHEKYLNARLLRATVANHEGTPSLADEIFEELSNSEAAEYDPELFVEASAGRVVSLVDNGFVEEAERSARSLIEWIHSGNVRGNHEIRTRCRMKAYGVLGGQALLHKALADRSAAKESLEHLKSALAAAEELRLDQEIAFDLVQIALWHALFQAGQTESNYHETAQRLDSMDPKDSSLSMEYLRGHRFLGAYRCLLDNETISFDFSDWQLPSKGSAACDWLRATALKYRGALRCHTDDLPGAEQDFSLALSLMEYPTSPLLRFISGTIAADAAICETNSIEHFFNEATNRLASLPEDFCIRFKITDWCQAILESDKSHRNEKIRKCQANFRY